GKRLNRGHKDVLRQNREEGARRKEVEEKLQQIENQKKKNAPVGLGLRLERAGIKISPRNFRLFSAFFGFPVFTFAELVGSPPLLGAMFVFIGVMGFPRWLLKTLTRRRLRAFEEKFVDAIDIIVRGVRSGLSVNQCLQIIANEMDAPVGGEFSRLMENLDLGVSVSDALKRLSERVPSAEVQFFSVVLSVQQQTGGNLAESLQNLSHVLRERRKLRSKIISISQEAKVSAGIIGALPIVVSLALYFVAPEYITVMFTTLIGQILIAAAVIWMAMGTLIMKMMINFDF
ncbi:MAG: type II secretion system F family protein, partial [Parvibaculales bacterium]